SAWRFHTSEENAPPLRQRVEVNQVGALLQMVRRHAGIALLPLYAVSDDLADGTLVEVLPGTLRMDEHGLYAIYLPNRYGSPKLRAFVDFLEAHMREHAAAWEQAAEET
ncbi:LysR substrate-binding domain-containing protein, partial [Amnimonas aquatica]